jgi:hypothetical protein
MKTLILVGSSRKPRSNSESIACFLHNELQKRGSEANVVNEQAYRRDDAIEALREQLVASNCLVIVAPVYVDSLPAPLLKLLLRIYEGRSLLGHILPACYAVIHSGYPEVAHRLCAIESCQYFSREMRFVWQGALSFGGTSPIGGAPLETLGLLTRKLRTSLGYLAEAIVNRQPVPEAARILGDRRAIPLPIWAIVSLLNWRFTRVLREKGVTEPLARPYE